jgi:hypothetical protein
MGLGVTPSAWNTYKAIEIGRIGNTIAGFNGGTEINIAANAYYDSAWKYAVTSLAGKYTVDNTSATHKWYTAASGTAGNTISFTQAMTLDASGKLGIGATSLTANLTVADATRASAFIQDTAGRTLRFQSPNSSGAAATIGTSTNHDLVIEAGLNSGGANLMAFNTAGSERARIDSSGRLLVGASSFTLNTTNFTAGSAYVDNSLFIGNTSGTGSRNCRLDTFTDEFFIVWADGNTDNNSIKYAYGGTAWVNTSDETLKDIIEPITNAVSKVCSLRSVIGKFKNEEEGVRHPFLIAQDVQAVLPEAVYINKSRVEGEPDTLGVGYTDVIPLLVAAIKEQQALITQLQADVAALKGTA